MARIGYLTRIPLQAWEGEGGGKAQAGVGRK